MPVFFRHGLANAAVRRKKTPCPPRAGMMSSYLVALMRAWVPKVSRCWGPTEVIRPYWGRTMRQIFSISPTCRAPISATKISVSGVRCSRMARVTPKEVLKLPGVVSTR